MRIALASCGLALMALSPAIAQSPACVACEEAHQRSLETCLKFEDDALRACIEAKWQKTQACMKSAGGCEPTVTVERAESISEAFVDGNKLILRYTTTKTITESKVKRTAAGGPACAVVNLDALKFQPSMPNTVYSWSNSPGVTPCDLRTPIPPSATRLHIQDFPVATDPMPMKQQDLDHAYMRSATESKSLALIRARPRWGAGGLDIVRRMAADPTKVEFHELYLPFTRTYVYPSDGNSPND